MTGNELASQNLRAIARNYPDVTLDSRGYSRNCIMFQARHRNGKVDIGWCSWSESGSLYSALITELKRLRKRITYNELTV